MGKLSKDIKKMVDQKIRDAKSAPLKLDGTNNKLFFKDLDISSKTISIAANSSGTITLYAPTIIDADTKIGEKSLKSLLNGIDLFSNSVAIEVTLSGELTVSLIDGSSDIYSYDFS